MKNSIRSIVALSLLSVASSSAYAENTWQDRSKDAWLDGKAESTLLFNTNLNSFDINTDVQNGVVILTGKVESDVDKALAEELVASLEGVDSVDNRLTVLNNKANKDSKMLTALMDSKIATVVKTKLLFESEISGTAIEVEVKEGVVTLLGHADSDAAKELAIAIAKNTTDVKSVVDNLTVTTH
ncbi:BON domain-containing protein [Colwellia sp. M166]|uniref:BON domain-containing protein n=1 Tax=Colwellia sp. M166 TaxID=2583805 RepID=UPI00211EBAF7|nr:BON domain-containing protein [Colwellia sp. M166]UUO23607.1 BON domain-containing protein [Colwellia sp. M166]|tara:strand:+ start:44546 stop:45097 length:552 start_codon:yes stop_codon:yes gene_type:complete